MALEQRNQIRSRERIGILCRVGARFVEWAGSRATYLWLDNSINVLQLALAVSMKVLGCPLVELFVALWIFDFVAAGFFVGIYETTGKELSFGTDFRQAVDVMRSRSGVLAKTLGFLAMLWVNFMSVVWYGPEQVVAYYRKEIGTRKQLLTALAILTGIQAFLWAALYFYGYDFVIKYL